MLKPRLISWLLWVSALVAVSITCAQAVAFLNPVPVWDMWEGYLGFFERLHQHDGWAWIAPHNEHRIFLQRILFWIDDHAFRGANLFLIFANLALILANALLLWRCQVGTKGSRDYSRQVFLPVTLIWCYLMCQDENIRWAFQGQFHLAYLVPLAAFRVLAHAGRMHWRGPTACAVVLGGLSVGTMGNGVLALPLLGGLSVARKLPVQATAWLAAACVVCLLALGAGGDAAHRGGLLALVLQHPLGLLHYLLRLLGSPFYYLCGESDRLGQAELAGALYLLLFGIRLLRAWRTQEANADVWCLLTFAAYVILSYAGASAARYSFGMRAPFTPHYTTPALLAWVALAALHGDPLERLWQRPAARALLLVGVAAMLALQVRSIGGKTDRTFAARGSLLGLALGVDDQQAQRTLTAPEFYRQIPQYAEPAYRQGDGPFQDYPYANLRDRFGQRDALPTTGTVPACHFGAIKVRATTDARFLFFEGDLALAAPTDRLPDLLWLRDAEGRALGAGVIQSDLASRLAHWVRQEGRQTLAVRGYVRSTAGGVDSDVVAQTATGPVCAGRVRIPEQAVQIGPAELNPAHVTLGEADVIARDAISGTDGFHTELCSTGLRVFGTSGPAGDADTGVIKLRVKPGSTMLYRTGPNVANLRIIFGGRHSRPLPRADEWTLIRFTAPGDSGDQDFEIALVDASKEWGTWLAIAVRSERGCTGGR